MADPTESKSGAPDLRKMGIAAALLIPTSFLAAAVLLLVSSLVVPVQPAWTAYLWLGGGSLAAGILVERIRRGSERPRTTWLAWLGVGLFWLAVGHIIYAPFDPRFMLQSWYPWANVAPFFFVGLMAVAFGAWLGGRSWPTPQTPHEHA